jgi:protein SCO1/2
MQLNHRQARPTVTILLLLVTALLVAAGSPAAAADKGGTPWGADYFPNVPLVTHEGKKVRFFDDLIKDKVVMINFIFTSCPDVCPLETARLREVQKILGDRVGQDVFMYSISIDPEVDTPEVLKRYAEKFEAGPGWLFLTGNKEDTTELRRKLGLYREEEPGLTQHSTNLIIGNQKTGRWSKISPFENPYIIATQVGSWLHNWKLPPRTGQDYASAPEVRTISKGEQLFRTRCAACHTVGAEDAAASAKEPLGPDLLNVHRKRDRAWLTRWLMEPDKMLAEKDPLAMALLAEWNNVPMPNLRLSQSDVQDLLTYIAEESHRVEHSREGGHHHH